MTDATCILLLFLKRKRSLLCQKSAATFTSDSLIIHVFRFFCRIGDEKNTCIGILKIIFFINLNDMTFQIVSNFEMRIYVVN